MKLLIVTQAVDLDNSVMSFFHGWIKEFSKKFESIIVICLEKGRYDLPENVKVFSLGKENKKSRIMYIWNFYKHIWRERKNYDAVFVHMNQEYILLGWKTWWILGKKIYMWRNHQDGSLFTDIASLFCKKVFCTSKFSYTAKYQKTVLMPVGVDTKVFKVDKVHQVRKANSILFLGRIAPVKKPDLLIEALEQIKDIPWALTIVGDPLSRDVSYYEELKKLSNEIGVESKVTFQKAVSNTETPNIYSKHKIFVNLSPSGMYDKTIFEAMACGCIVLASNKNLIGQIRDDFLFEEGNRIELTKKLYELLHYSDEQSESAQIELRTFSQKHDINSLTEEIFFQLNND